MTQAANQAGSVHAVTSIPVQGETATYVNDTGTDSGTQTVTLGPAEVSARAVDGVAYVNANASAITGLFQGSAAAAQQFAGKWLSFPSSSPAYRSIVETLTLPSFLQQVTPAGSVTKLGSSVVEGQSVIGLRGALPGGFTGTLYVATSGAPVPVEEAMQTPNGITTIVFSHWGEAVNVSAPPDPIPGSEVQGF
jgi:hypothetical protein